MEGRATRPERAFGIYNPAALSATELLEEFVARQRLLDEALAVIRGNARGQPQQHLLYLGARGMGKTMMQLAIAHSLERDPRLASEWVPVVFPEEAYYGVADLADFWLKACEYQFDKLGLDGAAVDALHDVPEAGLEERARELLLSTVEAQGKRTILFVENLGEFFDAVSDPADQHRLRAFLMDDDRVMLIGSATSYFEAVADIDRPFFDFFRVFRLARFTREEMFEALRRIAEARGDKNVLKVLDTEPQRVEGLRILTGGNPRLIKVIYRLLREGAFGDVRRDLDRLLDDCTPYFKHRIENLSGEQRRVFDRVARQWDPVAAKDLQRDLRRPSNKISTYLRRLVEEGFLEEVAGSTESRKRFQVAERFYNIYYLMRFSRAGRRRLEWLGRYMQVLYTPEDYRQWVDRVLSDWNSLPAGPGREHRTEFLHALMSSTTDEGLQRELAGKVVAASWNADQLASLHELLDRGVAAAALHGEASILEFLSGLSADDKKRIDYRPEDARWWYGLTDELEAARAWEAAETAYRRAIELEPKDARPWNGLGNLLQGHLGRPDEAEAAYRRAIELDPKGAYPWNGLGNLLQGHLGRPDEAEAAYRRAIELDPKGAYPWNGLGNLLKAHLGRPDEAEAAYRRAIELDPKYAYPWNGLGNLLQGHLGRPDEAEAAYRCAIELEPKYARPWNGLGNLLKAHLGRPDEAVAAYRRAIELEPKYASPWNGLGNLLQGHLGRPDEAEAAYRCAIELEPKYARPWNGLGNLLGSDLERPDEAEAAYRRAIELDPKYAYPWTGLGNLLQHNLGRLDEAEAAYRRAIELDPKDAYPHAGLAKLLHEQENHDEARREALASATRGPDVGWARSVFLQVCEIDAQAWIEVLPAAIAKLASTGDAGLHEFVVQGLVHLAGSRAASLAELARTITGAGGEEPLAELLLALRAADDPGLLDTVAPERRSVAEDLLARIGRPVRGGAGET